MATITISDKLKSEVEKYQHARDFKSLTEAVEALLHTAFSRLAALSRYGKSHPKAKAEKKPAKAKAGKAATAAAKTAKPKAKTAKAPSKKKVKAAAAVKEKANGAMPAAEAGGEATSG